MNKIKMLCVCVVFVGISLAAFALDTPTKITQEPGSVANPSELIWLGSIPNTTARRYFMCGTGLPPFHYYHFSGLIINESGEIIHKVTGRSTPPDQSNAIHLGWGNGSAHNVNDPAMPRVMHYGHINDGTPVTRILINEQGATFSYRSSTRPESLDNGWFRCKVTQKHSFWGGADSNEKPSDVFFLSPDLQRIDSIEDLFGIQFALDTRLDPYNEQLIHIGKGFAVIDSGRAAPLYPVGQAPKRNAPAIIEKESTGFINTATGVLSTHRCGYVREANLTFDSRAVLITSNWDSESLYDPISDTVFFSAYKIIGLLDDNRAIVLLKKGDQHYQIVNKQGDMLGQIEDKIRIDHVTQDGIVQYSKSDPNLSFNQESLTARLVFDEKQSPKLDRIGVRKFDLIYPSRNLAFYAPQINTQYALDHAEPIKRYILNASLKVTLEFEAAEYPMHITRSGKVLTYSETSKQYTLHTPEGEVIKVIDVAQELAELLPMP